MRIARALALVARSAAAQTPAPVTIERLIDTGRLGAAREQLARLRVASPESPRVLLLDAMILYREDKPAEALAQLQRLLSALPQHANGHKLAALCLVALRRADEAGPHIAEAVRLAPDDFMARYYLGLHQIDRRQPERAAATFVEAITRNPDYPDSHTMFGFAMEQLGRDEEALPAYRKGVELNERLRLQRASPGLYLGRFLQTRHRDEEALPVLEAAVGANGQSAESWLLLGKARAALGRYEPAVAALDRAFELSPRDKRVRYALMQTYQRMGRTEDARRERAAYDRMASQELTRWEESLQAPPLGLFLPQ